MTARRRVSSECVKYSADLHICIKTHAFLYVTIKMLPLRCDNSPSLHTFFSFLLYFSPSFPPLFCSPSLLSSKPLLSPRSSLEGEQNVAGFEVMKPLNVICIRLPLLQAWLRCPNE